MTRKPHSINDPKTGSPITTTILDPATFTAVTLEIGGKCDGLFRVPATEGDARLTFLGRIDTNAGWLQDVFGRTTLMGTTVYEMRMPTGLAMAIPESSLDKLVTVW